MQARRTHRAARHERRRYIGWPAGQPSAEVRGVFNAFRTAAADEQNYFDGAGSLDAATASFQAAVDQYRALVGD